MLQRQDFAPKNNPAFTGTFSGANGNVTSDADGNVVIAQSLTSDAGEFATDGNGNVNARSLNAANLTGNLTGIGEATFSLGASLSGTVTCNYANAEVQYGTLAGATTLTFSNPPASGTSGTLTVILTGDGTHSVTFPAAVSWGDAGAPTQPFAAKRYYLTFTTHDAGTHWDAVAVGGF